MKNIFILPTDEASRLYEIGGELTLSVANTKHKYNIGRNIYITNQEKPKLNNWYFDGIDFVHKMSIHNDSLVEGNKKAEKIILTNNPKLIADGVQELTEEQLKEIVSKYPLDYVEVKKGFADGTAYGYNFLDYSLFFNSFSAEKTQTIQETFNYFEKHKPNNKELEESIRQIFKDETKNKLWSENEDNDCGFSEEYVFWLEQKLISYAKR